MGGDCSQKLSPGGESHSSPGHSKPPAQLKFNTLPQKRSASGQRSIRPRAMKQQPPRRFLFFLTRSFFPNQFVFHTFAR